MGWVKQRSRAEETQEGCKGECIQGDQDNPGELIQTSLLSPRYQGYWSFIGLATVTFLVSNFS